MKLAYGILATVALGLVLFVVTNFWSSRVSSASSSGSSSDDNGDSWWDWTGYGAADNGDDGDNGGWIEAAWDAGPGYAWDVWSALTSGAE